jgi:hypothetical protein
MSLDRQFFPGGFPVAPSGRLPRVALAAFGVAFAANIARKRRFLYSSMDTSFFEGLESSGLSMGQSRFDATFGKGPSSPAGLHQEKLDAIRADAVADGGHLLGSEHFLEVR